jgi:hypothetical protein
VVKASWSTPLSFSEWRPMGLLIPNGAIIGFFGATSQYAGGVYDANGRAYIEPNY